MSETWICCSTVSWPSASNSQTPSASKTAWGSLPGGTPLRTVREKWTYINMKLIWTWLAVTGTALQKLLAISCTSQETVRTPTSSQGFRTSRAWSWFICLGQATRHAFLKFPLWTCVTLCASIPYPPGPDAIIRFFSIAWTMPPCPPPAQLGRSGKLQTITMRCSM